MQCWACGPFGQKFLGDLFLLESVDSPKINFFLLASFNDMILYFLEKFLTFWEEGQPILEHTVL